MKYALNSVNRSSFSFFILLLFSFSFSFAQLLDAKGETPAYSSNRLLVKGKPGIYQWDYRSTFTQYGLKVKKRLPKERIDIIELQKTPVSLAAVKKALEASGEYEWVEYDYELELDTNDTYWGSLWHLNNTFFTKDYGYGNDIDAPYAWQTETGDESVVIAVIDTGVDYNHPDLTSNMWRNPGEIAANGIDDDNNGYIDDIYGIDAAFDDSDPMAVDAHGTHVAGIIGARGNNKLGVCGVMWQTQIMALQVARRAADGKFRTSNSDVIEALDYIRYMKQFSKVNIKAVNCSFGGSGWNSQALREAFQSVGDVGILVVCSAGNGGSDGIGDNNDIAPRAPSSFPQDRLIAVACSDGNDQLTSFSNFGVTNVDLSAPGNQILSTLPNNQYGYMSGTSMATPVVVGALGLLFSNDPGLTADDARDAIFEGVDYKKSLKGRVATSGRLNIRKSLDLVQLPFLSTPEVEETFERSDQWFVWDTNGRDADAWYLRVGSSKNGGDYYDSGILRADTDGIWVENLPTDGSTVHATFYWFINGSWRWRNYEYTAANFSPTMTSPAAGTVLTSDEVIFAWDSQGQPVTAWTLEVESEAFASDIVFSGEMTGDTFGYWVQNVPTDGRSIYARLGWEIDGQWTWQTYEYRAMLQP